MPFLSNPVVPTIQKRPVLLVDLSEATAGTLSALLSALAEAVRELAAAARAIKSQGTFVPASPAAAAAPTPTLAEAVRDFISAKARTGRSRRYVRQLRVSLLSLAKPLAAKPVSAVTAADLEAWLEGSRWSARTRRGYLADARVLFGWCQRRGWLAINPAAAVDVPAAVPKAPGIHTPEQVQAVLDTALRIDPGACRILAVRYFAGVRSAEALRLDECDLGAKFVRIEAAKAKTRRRRLVTITPALRAWLDATGEALPVSEKRVRRVVAACRAEWSPNVTRHSFVSYHVAAFGSAAKTALEAGHSEAMLFAHYRELVTPAEARRFWAIRPK